MVSLLAFESAGQAPPDSTPYIGRIDVDLKRILRERLATVIALAAALSLAILALANYDVLRFGVQLVLFLQPQHIDELIAIIVLIFAGLTIDQLRAKRRADLEAKMQAERLLVLKATMRTVQDIVNNFLQSMMLLEIEAGESVSPETTQLLERARRETFEKLKTLADLESTPEIEMAVGPGIDYRKGVAGQK
jgi:hypothetical protein